MSKLLIVDDDPDILQSLKLLCRPLFDFIDTETNPKAIPFLMNQSQFDMVLLDMNFKPGADDGLEGRYWLSEIKIRNPDVKVIMITAYGDVERAVEAMKSGAVDFIQKPWDNQELISRIKCQLKVEVSNLKSQYRPSLMSSNEKMKEVLATAQQVASTDADVLVLGENGTGKEVMAHYIHDTSSRKEASFIKVDLGAIPESLFESELFGHAKGAFTDAKADRKGFFEEAKGGTLFLDEIGNLSLPLQAKLLSALENRTIFKVGSSKPIPIDVRLVCATNANLVELVTNSGFREDLYYRINTIELEIPPLRERVEDIEEIFVKFVEEFSSKYNRKVKTPTSDLIKKIKDHSWPGNIRELKHCTERAVILTKDQVLKVENFKLTKASSSELLVNSLKLDDLEKSAIRKALMKNHGNISAAAEELGLTRASLYRRLEKHDL